MTEFTIALAGRKIEIRAIYETTRLYCKNYLTDGPADFVVAVSPEDIEFEREKSERENVVEGLPVQVFPPEYLETLAVYRKIADQMLRHDTFLFHGSAISVDGEGYLFTAKSGTGKSTHTRLWREHFGDRAVMINDDKPLLRVMEDHVLVCGTPWDGKHRISTNACVPLKGICVLERATENTIRRINMTEALPMLLQQCHRPGNSEAMMRLLMLLDLTSKRTGLYRLGCNMDPEAAVVAYEGMKG